SWKGYAHLGPVSTEKTTNMTPAQPSAGDPRLSPYLDYLGMNSPELLHGTLDALVLKTLAGGRRHGYAIARAIEEATDRVVEIEEGSLYTALYRMEKKGWVEAEWGLSELGRRAKFYRLTARGRRHLTAQTAEWARFATAISRVLLT